MDDRRLRATRTGRSLVYPVLRRSVQVLLALALVGCGGASAPAPEKAAQPATEKPAAPAPGKAAQPATEKPAAPAPEKAASGDRKQLTFGATAATSGAYTYIVSAAKVINAQVPDVSVTVAESGASVENINRMAQETFHLGIATADTAYKAINGIEPWPADKAVKDLRVLFVWDITAQSFVVREDSGVKKLEDLEGKDFNPGIRGSATENLAKQTLEALGIKPKLYIADTADAVAAIKDKRIVGFVKGSPPANIDSAILDLATATPIRVLAFTKDHFDKVLAKYPFFSTTQVQAGVYKAEWNAQPVPTLSQVQIVAARAKTLTDDQAYKMVKAIVEDNKAGGAGVQASAWPSLKGVDMAKRTVESVLTPLHAGAQKYYAELGLEIPDKLRSPEAK